ncbi:MAG: hypothetical protein JEZ06_01665 [Anaerolineaceae bacterium]|nr:hypothetical protein [Anaerolineaceae bacterium]
MNKTQNRQRPFLENVLIIGLLGFSLLGWLRLYQIIQDWDLIFSFSMSVPSLYLAVGGGTWGLAFLTAGLALWLRWPRAERFTRFVVLFITSWYWIDRLFFTRSTASRSNLLFSILLSILGVLLTMIVLEFYDEKTQEEDNIDSPEESAAQPLKNDQYFPWK